MSRERQKLGRLGEDLALKKIKKLGYKPVTRNFRCALGEIDLIARHGEYLVFIEIKTRRGRSLGYAKEAVTLKKKRQISKVALAYMKENNCCNIKSRFDVIAVSIYGKEADIEVITDAFELAY